MQNSLVVFKFFILDGKYLLWANLVKKSKTVSLSWKLMVMFIFSVLDLFLASFVQKIHLAFWCYLTNLPVVYSQRLEVCSQTLQYKRMFLKIFFFKDFLLFSYPGYFVAFFICCYIRFLTSVFSISFGKP